MNQKKNKEFKKEIMEEKLKKLVNSKVFILSCFKIAIEKYHISGFETNIFKVDSIENNCVYYVTFSENEDQNYCEEKYNMIKNFKGNEKIIYDIVSKLKFYQIAYMLIVENWKYMIYLMKKIMFLIWM